MTWRMIIASKTIDNAWNLMLDPMLHIQNPPRTLFFIFNIRITATTQHDNNNSDDDNNNNNSNK